MLTESDCTFFLIQPDKTFERIAVEGVHWEDTRGINFNRTGVGEVDSVAVWIPLGRATLPVLSGKGNKRNYILRGIVADDVTEATEKAFLSAHDALVVTHITKNDFGNPNMQHWEVGAK